MADVPSIEKGIRLFTAPTLGRPALVLLFGGKSLHSLVHLSQLLLIGALCEPTDVVLSIERTRSLATAINQCLNAGKGVERTRLMIEQSGGHENLCRAVIDLWPGLVSPRRETPAAPSGNGLRAPSSSPSTSPA